MGSEMCIRDSRKPLIIEGARQVGKTWLMKEFGKQAYDSTVYINFDSNSQMSALFAADLDVKRLIFGLELYSGQKIDPDHTLLIFDEVQEVPRALTSLKYFCENAPQYHIICAGSLLGIALHEGTSFPVGKVDFLKLYPLSFKEFLMATGKERYAELLNSGDFSLITSFKQTYIDALKYYYFVGGMPEAVQWCLDKNLTMIGTSDIHQPIQTDYDFSKDEHRTMTFVFAKERSLKGIREALDNRRTAAYYRELVIGREDLLRPFFEKCVEIEEISRNEKGVTLSITNTTDLVLKLKKTAHDTSLVYFRDMTLKPHTRYSVRIGFDNSIKGGDMNFEVTNFIVAPDKGLEYTIYL